MREDKRNEIMSTSKNENCNSDWEEDDNHTKNQKTKSKNIAFASREEMQVKRERYYTAVIFYVVSKLMLGEDWMLISIISMD